MSSNIMKDSNIDDGWLRDMMAKNPPGLSSKGDVLTGPVRLSFPNLFQVGKPQRNADGTEGAEGKYGAALLFPPGTDMAVFNKAWGDAAKAAFPKNWGPDGKPVGLHHPFHRQDEKAFGAKPLVGYTPGALFVSVSSRYKPPVVDMNRMPVTDEHRVYPGVWAIVALNVYSYKNLKTGVGFGIQTVMLIADDQKLGGVGANPESAFENVTITANANVAAKFDEIRRTATEAQASDIMPAGGHAGRPGALQTQPLPGGDVSMEDLLG